MKIAIDIDDVLADSITALIDYYNSLYEPKIFKKDLCKYSYWGFLGETREEANQKYFNFCDSDYFSQIKPSAGSVEAIEKMSLGHDLYLITGRPLFIKEETSNWVEKYFPNKFRGIYFTNDRTDKNDVSAYWGKKKAEICDEIGAEALVDDLFEYIKDTDHLKVFLYDQVWNNGELSPHVVRVKGWAEIAEYLK